VSREKQNWDSHAVVVENRYHIKDAWLGKDGEEFHVGMHYNVGGNTKFYGAALIRLRKEDFGELRHVDGISPAWPLRYEDLELYYTQTEHLDHVHGERGSDPTEPAASAPYEYPAVSHEPRIQEI
jgi:choline dehydrogenase-like flavoprotein